MVTSIKGNDTSTFGGNIDVPQIVTDAPVVDVQRSSSAGNQNITASTWNKVQFDTVLFDTTSDYDTTNYRFIPSVAGYYQVNGITRMNYSGTAGNQYWTSIYKNGSSTQLTEARIHAGSGNPYGVQGVSGIVYMNGSTDYLEIYIWVSHTSAWVQTTTTRLTAVLVRAV